jgi:hypothetical protein
LVVDAISCFLPGGFACALVVVCNYWEVPPDGPQIMIGESRFDPRVPKSVHAPQADLPPAVATPAYNCVTRLRNRSGLSGLTSQIPDYRERTK